MKLWKQTILALLLLALLSSCGNTTANDTDADTSPTQAETTTSTTETVYPLAVSSADYGGETFRSLCYTQTEPGTMKQYLDFGWSEERSGEVLNDAIFSRNLRVEEDFNVVIDWLEVDDVKTTAKNAIIAGETDYNVVQVYINDAMTMGQDGSVWDLVPLLDLDAPWWDPAIQRDLELGGKLYCATGYLTLGEEELNYGVYYNKALVKKYGLDDPYTMVEENKWTLDVMYTAAQGATYDVNGDGTLDANDAYGIGSDYGLSAVLFYGTGGKLARVSSDGSPEIVLNTSANEAVIEKLSTMFSDKNASIMVTDIGSDGWTILDNMLMEDRLLFRPGSIYDINGYREMISDFGILPNPKWDETQAEYCHIIASHVCPAISVPVTITGDALEHTTTLLEALSCYADKVVEAYYDVNLTTKLVRDEESAAMFDIIFSTQYYDLGKVFAWGSIESVIGTTVQAGGGFASTYAANESKILAAMEKTWEFYSE